MSSSKFAGLALEVETPQRMIVVHPVTRQPLRDGDGKEAYVDLYSGDSEAAARHERTVLQRQLAARVRGAPSADEVEADAIDLLSALTVGWYLVDPWGNPVGLDFTPEAARELYALRAAKWLREQVDQYIGNRANFFKASPKT